MKKRYKSARQVDSVIDLEKIRSGPEKCMERDPEVFFRLTYPSSDISAMLRAISRRFSPKDTSTSETGVFLAESVKGLGKSHGLLTAYHLFSHPKQALPWMESLGFSWDPPKDPVIIVEKFTDQTLPFDSLWTALGRRLEADSFDKAAADALIRSYVNIWERLGVDTSDEYLARSKNAYPFLPELIELIFERITESGGFQGTRGALGLLAAMLDATPSGSFLLTAAHCKISDQACADRLQDLDPSATLINCAASNLRDLAGQPYAEALASAGAA